MTTRVYNFVAMIEEVTKRLGGNADSVSYTGKMETYQKGNKKVEVERMFMFDDDNGNVYDIR